MMGSISDTLRILACVHRIAVGDRDHGQRVGPIHQGATQGNAALVVGGVLVDVLAGAVLEDQLDPVDRR